MTIANQSLCPLNPSMRLMLVVFLNFSGIKFYYAVECSKAWQYRVVGSERDSLKKSSIMHLVVNSMFAEEIILVC